MGPGHAREYRVKLQWGRKERKDVEGINSKNKNRIKSFDSKQKLSSKRHIVRLLGTYYSQALSLSCMKRNIWGVQNIIRLLQHDRHLFLLTNRYSKQADNRRWCNMSNLVSSNAPGKKFKEVTCCAKCTFFTRKRRKNCPQGAALLPAPNPMHLFAKMQRWKQKRRKRCLWFGLFVLIKGF